MIPFIFNMYNRHKVESCLLLKNTIINLLPSREARPRTVMGFFIVMETKKCSKCKVEKPLNEFGKNRRYKDGLSYYCKECKRKHNTSSKEYSKKHYLENKEKYSSCNKKWRNNNREKTNELARKYNNSDKGRQYKSKWEEENTHIRRWRSLLRAVLRKLNKPKQDTTHNLLGYSANELKEHLDNKGMDWKKDQIDHCIPASWFKEDTPMNVVNDLWNLQPLDEETNKIKNNSYMSPVPDDYLKVAINFIQDKYKNRIV